jgi:hypothetical protein
VPVPTGTWGEVLNAYLQELEDRISAQEVPQGPVFQGVMASTSLSVTNAQTYKNAVVALSDLGKLAYSDGSHWYPITMGAAII